MIALQQILEAVTAISPGMIAVTMDEVEVWAKASGARLAVNDNYVLEAEPEIVEAILVEFLAWCAANHVDPAWDDERSIPAMERLLGASGLHPALMTEALSLCDAVCERLPGAFAENQLEEFSDENVIAIGF